ncbi:MAG: hypothetical protein HY444_08350 [Nitrospirae bacterium]|nr:hypothetical protein [Nitrospirota bacterium]
MNDSSEQAVRQAISTILQSDPLIKLLQEVKLGRMKPTDAGLRAITEAWLGTYKKVLETSSLDRTALARLDPSPRLYVLIDAGILPADHAAAASLRAAYRQSFAKIS